MPTIVRNLPVCEKYKIVDSRHSGGIEAGEVCTNCGRIIVEVAIVEDSHGNRSPVGMDCAATLTGIHAFDLSFHEGCFAEVRSFASKYRKAAKLAPSPKVSIHEYAPGAGAYAQGGFTVQIGEGPNSPGYFWKNYPVEMKSHLLPYIARSCTQ